MDITRDEDVHVKFTLEMHNSMMKEKESKKQACLDLIESFEENDRLDIIDEITKRNLHLKIKKLFGHEMPLTQQLILYQSDPRRYLQSQIKPELNKDAKLLTNLLKVAKFWQVDKCTDPFWPSSNIIFSIEPIYFSLKDKGQIGNRYNISDIVTFFADIKKEGLVFYCDDDYFVDENNKKHKLSDDETRYLFSKKN